MWQRLAFLACFLFSPVLAAGEFVPGAYDPAKLTAEMKAQTDVIAAALEELRQDGWKRAGVVERYTPVNMYDKINGRSELFMSYGVIGMTWVNFRSEANEDLSIEIYLYDQADTLNAFGVFSVERWQDSPAVAVGEEGYRTDTDLFFRKGPYYVSILGSDEDAGLHAAQLALAKRLADLLTSDGAPLWGDEALPREGRVPNSLKYFRVDAMSLDFMGNTFVCDVAREGMDITHFVSRQPDENKAAAALTAFEKYLNDYGDNAERVTHEDAEFIIGDAGGGYYDAVFRSGVHVAGVSAVKDRQAALAAAAALRRHLAGLSR